MPNNFRLPRRSLTPRCQFEPLEARQLLSSSQPTFVVGDGTSELIATLKQKNYTIPNEVLSNGPSITAQIDWGDGTTSPATLQRNTKGSIEVLAGHAYSVPKNFKIKILVSTNGGPAKVIQQTTGKVVRPSPLKTDFTGIIMPPYGSNNYPTGMNTPSLVLTQSQPPLPPVGDSSSNATSGCADATSGIAIQGELQLIGPPLVSPPSSDAIVTVGTGVLNNFDGRYSIGRSTESTSTGGVVIGAPDILNTNTSTFLTRFIVTTQQDPPSTPGVLVFQPNTVLSSQYVFANLLNPNPTDPPPTLPTPMSIVAAGSASALFVVVNFGVTSHPTNTSNAVLPG